MTPTLETTIRNTWAARLWKRKGYDSPDEFKEPGNCFACGMESKELKTRVPDGGCADQVGDMHLLCEHCESSSKGLYGSSYWRWFLKRTAADTMTAYMMRKVSGVFTGTPAH